MHGFALLQEQRRVRVPQVVEADARQGRGVGMLGFPSPFRPLHDAGEVARDVVRIDRPAVRRREDEVKGPPFRAGNELPFRLPLAMPPQ